MQERTLTKADKALVALAFANAGIKARIRMLRLGFRVVFEGGWEPAAAVLNSEGYLTAGGEAFGRFSFQGQQAFVRYAK